MNSGDRYKSWIPPVYIYLGTMNIWVVATLLEDRPCRSLTRNLRENWTYHQLSQNRYVWISKIVNDENRRKMLDNTNLGANWLVFVDFCGVWVGSLKLG